MQNGGADIWADSAVTFLDPCTKSGVFLREIATRLIKGLEGEIPDLQARVDHILTKQLFGIGITRLTARELQTLAAVGSNIAQPVKVIAANLCISEPALRDQLNSIYSKLGVFGRLGLYPYARPRALPLPAAAVPPDA